MLHGPLIALLPQRYEPGQFILDEDDFEIREPRRGILAGFGSRLKGFQTRAHGFVVSATLELRGVELSADACYESRVTALLGAGILKLAFQGFEFLLEGVPAGVGVLEIAVGFLEFGVADVEAAAGVGEVLHAFEVVFGEVGAACCFFVGAFFYVGGGVGLVPLGFAVGLGLGGGGEGDELVDEVVVEVREGFDGGVGRVGGEVDGHFDDVICGGGVVV